MSKYNIKKIIGGLFLAKEEFSMFLKFSNLKCKMFIVVSAKQRDKDIVLKLLNFATI